MRNVADDEKKLESRGKDDATMMGRARRLED